jgi:aryl-alcohol dehydrogenase-like predicted oxidoreductase
MEKRTLGKTGMQVSILGFGGSEIGYDKVPQKTVNEILHRALDAGLNVIDTAECYMDSEEKIGRAIAGRRDQCYLFTKCGHATGLPFPDWDPRLLEQSIERSLRRLQTDYLDLVQLHTCSEKILRQGVVIEVLQRAREAGKIRYIGYSGDSRAALYAIQTGLFDVLQTSINIADQEAIDLILPLARQQGIGIIAKRPLANVAWRTFEKPEDGHTPSYWDLRGYNEIYTERLQQLDYDFLKGALRTAIGIALRFTLSVEGVATAIVGTTKPGRWHQNAELLAAGPLDSKQFEAIRTRWKAVAKPHWIGQG